MVEELFEMCVLNVFFVCCFEDFESYVEKKFDDVYLCGFLVKFYVLVMIVYVNGVFCGGLVVYEFEKFE